MSAWDEAASALGAGDVAVAAALYFLATLDSAFVGYREAAGRSALIRKGAYYTRAILRGALWGQAAVALAFALLALLFLRAGDGAAFLHSLNEAGRRMLSVYVPYAVVVLAAFAVRAAPSVDVRSMTSTLVFGPFQFIRPLVVVAGVLWGLFAAGRADVTALGLFVIAEMLLLDRWLRYLRARRIAGHRGEAGRYHPR
ncbi:MAG TPA: hypothetical protein VGP08_22705 [Pyrinomonadaceae bacterium]|nr:hypothetical protein [Pyrinomonadaceae bacterium]